MLLVIYEDYLWVNCECVLMVDLVGEKLLMLEDGYCLCDQVMGFCFEVGVDEDIYFCVISLEILCNMVVVGSGIILLLVLVVLLECKCDGVVYLLCIKLELCCIIGLVYCFGLLLCSCYEQLVEVICVRMDGYFDKVLKQVV